MSVATISKLPLYSQDKKLLRKIFVDASPTYEEAIRTIDRANGFFGGPDKRALARLASGTSENPAFDINNMNAPTKVKRWLRENV
jgi:hypothetical protein